MTSCVSSSRWKYSMSSTPSGNAGTIDRSLTKWSAGINTPSYIQTMRWSKRIGPRAASFRPAHGARCEWGEKRPSRPHGVLEPTPSNPFNRTILASIRFHAVADCDFLNRNFSRCGKNPLPSPIESNSTTLWCMGLRTSWRLRTIR